MSQFWHTVFFKAVSRLSVSIPLYWSGKDQGTDGNIDSSFSARDVAANNNSGTVMALWVVFLPE